MGEMTHEGNQDSWATLSRERVVNIERRPFAYLQGFSAPSIAQQYTYTFRKSQIQRLKMQALEFHQEWK